MIDATTLAHLIKTETGFDVEIIAANPVCVTGVSMKSLGIVGTLFVFRDDTGTQKAIPVPFGIHEQWMKDLQDA